MIPIYDFVPRFGNLKRMQFGKNVEGDSWVLFLVEVLMEFFQFLFQIERVLNFVFFLDFEINFPWKFLFLIS